MAEAIGLAASIVQVAGFGLTLSRTLHDYGASVVGAEKRLKGLDKDIEYTSRIISQLGTRLKDAEVQVLVAEDTIRLTQDVLAECDAIFHAMEDVVTRIRNSGMGKWTIYFRETKIELMRANLDRMKGNLQLLLGVIIHGTQMANEQPDDALVAAHRAKIRELMLEKEQYTQRYLEEKKKYDDLLAKVNSTSTLNSILTTGSIDDSRLDIGNVIARPQCSPVSPGSSSRPREPLASEAAAVFSSNMSTLARGPQVISAVETPAGAPADEHPSQEGLARLSSLSHGIASKETETPALSPDRRLWQQRRESEPRQAAQASLQSPPTIRAATRRRKRDIMAKAAKNTAKAAGIATGLVVGVALFPISIPVFVVWRRRQRWNEDVLDPTSHAYAMSAPEMSFGEADPNGPYFGSHHHGQQPYYRSSELYGELPGIHELHGPAPVELSLVNQLTRRTGL
ncbi:hypothetical protein OQA88_3082 [Cercophora sp. LCS_1]